MKRDPYAGQVTLRPTAIRIYICPHDGGKVKSQWVEAMGDGLVCQGCRCLWDMTGRMMERGFRCVPYLGMHDDLEGPGITYEHMTLGFPHMRR